MSDQAQQQMPVEDQLVEQRQIISNLLKYVKVEVVSRTQPPVVQEVVLAQRALEDARMRLGRALGLLKGHDPDTVILEAKETK